jgi:hypothetical protein
MFLPYALIPVYRAAFFQIFSMFSAACFNSSINLFSISELMIYSCNKAGWEMPKLAGRPVRIAEIKMSAPW